MKDYLGIADAAFLIKSDRSKGLTKAVDTIFPQAHHSICVEHLIRNMDKHIGAPKALATPLHSLVHQAAQALTQVEASVYLDKIKTLSSAASGYLKHVICSLLIGLQVLDKSTSWSVRCVSVKPETELEVCLTERHWKSRSAGSVATLPVLEPHSFCQKKKSGTGTPSVVLLSGTSFIQHKRIICPSGRTVPPPPPPPLFLSLSLSLSLRRSDRSDNIKVMKYFSAVILLCSRFCHHVKSSQLVQQCQNKRHHGTHRETESHSLRIKRLKCPVHGVNLGRVVTFSFFSGRVGGGGRLLHVCAKHVYIVFGFSK